MHPPLPFDLVIGLDRSDRAADLCVLDATARWVVDSACFHSKSRNTPFQGRSLVGRPALTVAAGRLVHDREAPPA